VSEYDRRRSRRKHPIPAQTIPARALRREVRAHEDDDASGELPSRPTTRGECATGPRPCPFVGCRHHLYLDVARGSGAIKLNFPDVEVWEMPHSCVLDVAEQDGVTLERVGDIMNLTRERIRQIEARALAKLGKKPDDQPVGVERRRLEVFQ
jgi:hypothetical protein